MRIAISIPKPCHEDWNAMTPGAGPETRSGARFCASCQHSVADLTTATDAELVALFTSDAKPKCARFDPRQLERVLGDPQPSRHTLPIAAFSSLLAVAAGQEAVAQGGAEPVLLGEPAISAPPPPNTLRMGKMRIDPPRPVDTVPPIKMGEVVPHSIPPTDRPLIGDTVVMEQPEPEVLGLPKLRPAPTYYYIDGVKVCSNEDNGRTDHLIGDVKVITGGLPGTFGDGGIGPRTADPACTDTVDARDLPLSGRVVDATTGTVLRGATVTWVERGLHCCTDANGLFGFPVGSTEDRGGITLRIEATGHAPQERSMPLEKLPACMPIAMARSTEVPSPEGRPTIEHDTVVPEQRDTMVLGMAVLYKPTLWQRVSRPFRR